MVLDWLLVCPLESTDRFSLTLGERIWRLAPTLVASVKVILISLRQNIFPRTNIRQPQSLSGPMAANQGLFISLAPAATCTHQTNGSISAPDTAASPACNVCVVEERVVAFSEMHVHFLTSAFPSIPKSRCEN